MAIDPTIRISATNRKTVKTTCAGRKNDSQTRQGFRGCNSVGELFYEEYVAYFP